MRRKTAGRPGADRLNAASGRPYPRTKCEVGIRHFRDSLLTRDGEDSWCRGRESPASEESHRARPARSGTSARSAARGGYETATSHLAKNVRVRVRLSGLSIARLPIF